MPTIDSNNLDSVYMGNQLLDKVYFGQKQVFPVSTLNSFLYYRVEWNKILTEIQFSFDGSPSIQLNGDAGVESQIKDELDWYYSDISNVFNGNIPITNIEYVGRSLNSLLYGYIDIKFNGPKKVSSVWISPQCNNLTKIFNPCKNFNLYGSNDGINYSLIKSFIVSSVDYSSIDAPFDGTLLRPGQLIELKI